MALKKKNGMVRAYSRTALLCCIRAGLPAGLNEIVLIRCVTGRGCRQAVSLCGVVAAAAAPTRRCGRPSMSLRPGKAPSP